MSEWFENVVEASSEEAYYKCFDAASPTDPDPHTSYEKWYGPFERKIRRVLAHHGVPGRATEYFDDWCPNRTRHVTIERRYLTPEVILALHRLLKADYAFWRIDIIVVKSIARDDRLGQMALRADWVLCWGCARRMLPKP